MKETFDISTGDADQKELVQANQVTVDNSQCVENVATKLAASRVLKDQPHLNQPKKNEQILEKKQHDGSVTKEEEKGSCQYLEEMSSTTQVVGALDDKTQVACDVDGKSKIACGVDGKPEVNDNKVSNSDGQLPSTQFENMQSENVLQNTSTLASLE